MYRSFLRKRLFTSLVYLIFITSAAGRPPGKLWLPEIFSDNMVLQQGKPIPVWGDAAPASRIDIFLGENQASAKADAAGKWIAYLPQMKAGGPYILRITGPRSITIKNVMIGEVWFASGQSNMNFSIGRPVNDSQKVIRDARFPDIREFRVNGRAMSQPARNLPGAKWKVCSPENVPEFSAVAYFFAKELHLDRKVPVGIIHSSFNGTQIESWISAGYLGSHPDFKDTVTKVLQEKPDWEALDLESQKIDAARNAIVSTVNNGKRLGVCNTDYDDSEWRTFNFPLRASGMAVPDYSLIWARKEVEISKDDMNKDLHLELGTVVESEITYFNGVEIGRGIREGKRSYVIPVRLLKEGKNIIAVRFSNEWNNGRIGNDGEHPSIHSADSTFMVPLEGKWTYSDKIEPELPVPKVIYIRAPTGLFNGMVAPVSPYAIKGFLWYQGEGNAGRAGQYTELFPLMLMNWRISFRQGDLPFLFVQLPNYNAGWALIREAQASLLKYPKTGMAVTIDLGDPNNLHPGNKEPVGQRLYKAARQIAYHEAVECLSPVIRNWRFSGGAAFLNFENTAKGLMSGGDTIITGFMIAGKDHKFYPATAVITEGTIIKVYNKQVPEPCAVRYAWAGNPVCNLYNSAGLPCAPFRTDNWDE